jgi:hypothetical protein
MQQNGHNGTGVASLSDDLIAKARAIASRSDELLELLEDARQRLLDSDEGPEASTDRKPAPKRRFKAQAESKPMAAPKPRTRSGQELSEGLGSSPPRWRRPAPTGGRSPSNCARTSGSRILSGS